MNKVLLYTCLISGLFFRYTIGNCQEVNAPWTMILSGTKEEVTMFFGEYGDVPVPGDYDGDGITDLAVWRRYSSTSFKGVASEWIIKNSSDDKIVKIDFGLPSRVSPGITVPYFDVPIQADYDADGKCDPAYLNPETNEWVIRKSSDQQIIKYSFDPTPGSPSNDDFQFGWFGSFLNSSWRPAPADYDGDGTVDLGAFKTDQSIWKYKQSSDGQLITKTFGKVHASGEILDLPVPADYNGDKVADLAVWRPYERVWHVQNNPEIILDEAMVYATPGDYDGDGKADVSFFRSKPALEFKYIGDINIDHWYYDYQPSIMYDNGKYRVWWCGSSPRGYLDGVWYSESTSLSQPFSEPKLITEGDCYVSVIKVPSSISSAYNSCQTDSVYLMYTEGDNHNYTVNGSGYVTSRTADPYANKVKLYYSCDAVNWTYYGQVISPPDPVEKGAYGTGQPKARYINNKVFLTYYHHQKAADASSKLAVSNDGINFDLKGPVALTVGGRVSYHEDLDLFMGVGTANGKHISSLISDNQHGFERIFFTKDISAQGDWILKGPYAHIQDTLSAPKADLPFVGIDLFKNGSFEYSSKFGSFPPTLSNSAFNGQIALDNTISRGDEIGSLKYTATGSPSFTNPYTGSSSAVVDQPSDGVTYTFSSWMKTNGEDINVKAYIFCLDDSYDFNWGAGGPWPSGTFSFTQKKATGDWSRIEHTHTCPTGSKYVSVRLDNEAYTTTPVPANKSVWFDDMRMYRGREANVKTCIQGPDYVTNPQGIIKGKKAYFFGGHWNQKDECGHVGTGDFSIRNSDLYVMQMDLKYPDPNQCTGSMFRKCPDGKTIERRNCQNSTWTAWSGCGPLPYDSKFISTSIPSSISVCEPTNIKVTYVNTGTQTWTKPTTGWDFVLKPTGTFQDKRWRTLPVETKPGDTVTFNFTLQPEDTGKYHLKFQLMQGGVGVFGELSPEFDINVSDKSIPDITCPNNIVDIAPKDSASIPVSFQPPTVSDVCGSTSLTIVNGLPSGSNFPVGTTKQVYKATDEYGNSSQCTFDIIIHPETYNAKFIDQNIPAKLNGCEPTSIQVRFKNTGTQTWTKPATGWDIALTPQGSFSNEDPRWRMLQNETAPGDTATFKFELNAKKAGTYDLSFQLLRRGVGRFGEISNLVSIEVIDTVPPVISCPKDTIILTQNNSEFVKYQLPISTDDCLMDTVMRISGIASGGEFPIGTHKITHKATDVSGNIDTCSFIITVDKLTGIFESSGVKATIYPNPTSGLIKINIHQPDIKDTYVQVYNVLGKQVLLERISARYSEVILPGNLTDGLYLVQISSNGLTSFSDRVLLSR